MAQKKKKLSKRDKTRIRNTIIVAVLAGVMILTTLLSIVLSGLS